jgi:hypothetical protein
MGLNGE